MADKITFGDLRSLLEKCGFDRTPAAGPYVVYRHRAAGAVEVFRVNRLGTRRPHRPSRPCGRRWSASASWKRKDLRRRFGRPRRGERRRPGEIEPAGGRRRAIQTATRSRPAFLQSTPCGDDYVFLPACGHRLVAPCAACSACRRRVSTRERDEAALSAQPGDRRRHMGLDDATAPRRRAAICGRSPGGRTTISIPPGATAAGLAARIRTGAWPWALPHRRAAGAVRRRQRQRRQESRASRVLRGTWQGWRRAGRGRSALRLAEHAKRQVAGCGPGVDLVRRRGGRGNAPWVFPKGQGNLKPATFLNFGKGYTGFRTTSGATSISMARGRGSGEHVPRTRAAGQAERPGRLRISAWFKRGPFQVAVRTLGGPAGIDRWHVATA